MIIKWLDDAIDDLQALRQYISHDKPSVANRIARRIIHSVSMLSEQSEIGRSGRVSGSRELVISGTPFIVPYRIKNNTVEILRVLHSARQWPEDL